MAGARIRKSFIDGPAAAGRRVTLKPSLARQALLKISAATASLSFVPIRSRMLRKTQQTAGGRPNADSSTVRTVCTNCSVGCGIEAEVHNGVWVRQEVAADHPVSHGAHCCKGAGAIEMVTSPKRLKVPMKKVAGSWRAISWEQAIAEIGDRLLAIRQKHGPDALYFFGSAKLSTEMAYQQRKFAAFWGSNNIDHQARI